MEGLVRSDLNESTQLRITSAELMTLMDEGYKALAALGLCIEREEYAVTIPNHRLVKAHGHTVTYVELIDLGDAVYFIDTSDVVWTDSAVTWAEDVNPGGVTRRGLVCISPLSVGYANLNGTQPQYWFQWGSYIFIEPIPTTRYLLRFFYADTPTRAMSVMTTGYPEDLPVEFHPCIPKYAAAMACIKLKRWSDVVTFYNQYIALLQAARAAYIRKNPDVRASHIVPDEVKNG
jgi:hypothetical protein